jgi:hypothetical protein
MCVCVLWVSITCYYDFPLDFESVLKICLNQKQKIGNGLI